MSRDDRQELGKRGEKAACEHLKRQGYRILQRNYSCPTGEIDLICQGEDGIVFVEVKTRRDDASTDPEANITFSKQQRMARAARSWLAARQEPACAYRFDAVSVVMPDDGSPRVRHIVEAFVPSW